MWSGNNWLRIGPVAGCCESGDEPSRSGATALLIYLINVVVEATSVTAV
jgi:hypothetical protein